MVGWSIVLVAGSCVLLGAVVQGTVGFGVNLLAAPIIVLLEPSLMPVSLLIVGTVMPLITVCNEGRHIDRSVGWALGGRVAGTVPGVWLVVVLSADYLGIVIAVLILAMVAVTLVSVDVSPSRASLVGAGLASGITGTASGVGGPPLGLVYQRSAPSTARATTALVLVLGSLISLTALGFAGEVEAAQVWFGLLLVPFLAAGFLVALHVRARFQGELFRWAILAVVVVSSIAVIVRPALDSRAW